jgi:hypothetical protein
MGNAHSRHAAAFFRLQCLAKVAQGERFEQKSVESKQLLSLSLGRTHCQEQGLRTFERTDLFRQLSPRDSRHLQVDQQHIRAGRLIRCQQSERSPGVVGAEHLVALVSEQHSHQFKAYGIIIHQQNFVPGLDSS